MKKVAVIISPNWKDYAKKFLPECIKSLRGQIFDGKIKFFIADNETSETSFSFTPKPSAGAKHPKLDGEKCNGYDLEDFGEHYLRSFGKLYLHWIVAMYQESSNKSDFFRKDGFFRLLTGDVEFRKLIEAGKDTNEIWESFQDEVERFKITRKKYLLYSDFE